MKRDLIKWAELGERAIPDAAHLRSDELITLAGASGAMGSLQPVYTAFYAGVEAGRRYAYKRERLARSRSTDGGPRHE